MSRALNRYLCQQLSEQLLKRRVVVFYDPRREFESFFDELDQDVQDTIRRWCFTQPYGPAYPLRGVESTPLTEREEDRVRAEV